MITRCLNKDLSKEQGQQLQDARLRLGQQSVGPPLPHDEVVYIPIAFHFIAGKAPLPSRDRVIQTMHTILDTLNHDYGSKPASIYDLLPKKLPLLRNPQFLQTMTAHLNVAGCPNIQFVSARDPPIVLLQPCDMQNSDLTYWDEIIKIRTSPAFNPASTLNLWVIVNTTMPFLGYSQFPEAQYTPQKLAIDGVVIVESPAPYHLWKTASHEIGHFLGLQHTFYQSPDGRFDDGIDDTPYARAPSQGNPLLTNSWPVSIEPNGNESKHMFVCIMDYTNDESLLMFTNNQCQLIRSNLATVRRNWVLNASEAQQLYRQRRSLQSPTGRIIWKTTITTTKKNVPSVSSSVSSSVPSSSVPSVPLRNKKNRKNKPKRPFVPGLSPAPYNQYKTNPTQFDQQQQQQQYSPYPFYQQHQQQQQQQFNIGLVNNDKTRTKDHNPLENEHVDFQQNAYQQPLSCLSLFNDTLRLGQRLADYSLPCMSMFWD